MQSKVAAAAGGSGVQFDGQAFEQSRRKAAFLAANRLLEVGAANDQQLAEITAPLSGEELLNAVEERALANKCGNPTCRKPFDYKSAQVR